MSNNHVGNGDIGGVITSIYSALASLDASNAEASTPTFVPAVTTRKSLANPDNIISMIDGKLYRMLRRHRTRHGLTPEEYRKHYHLPADYAMVAPNYAAQRSALAVKIGLERKPKAVEAAPVPKARRKLHVAAPVEDAAMAE
ncbi:hypothetical protein AWL63_22645 [Sphingomonas panacis]|uniref:MucR family transcriptional regulator n=1 Tax=Sphingomonas panacis TaxID=1560345 RepID=A0A1B3ZFZ3_9SPHN|nr:MucR family transcriptional regulator [Sphingomonas panacis]AOH86337.1 hypothetical protein AWL63_22645 [Sphingomonas panacis]